MNSNKYRVVVEALKSEILSGKYASSERPFPSERMLVKRFGVSRPTISLALQELRGKGLLVRLQGSGTFLTKAARSFGSAVGLVVPGICYAEIFPPICKEISRLAQEKGLSLLFGDVSSPNPETRAKRAMELARKFAAEHVSGVILQPIEFLEDAERINREILSVFDKAGIPVVLIDYDIVPSPLRSQYDLVGSNNFEAGRRLAFHMKAAGAKHIVFLKRPLCAYSVENRILGASTVIAWRKPQDFVVTAEPTDLAAVCGVFKRKPTPDAIICGNDTMASRLSRCVFPSSGSTYAVRFSEMLISTKQNGERIMSDGRALILTT